MRHPVYSIGSPVLSEGSVPVSATCIRAAKRSFATRRIDRDLAAGLITGVAAPRAGDLVLARIGMLGQHRKIGCTDGRRATLWPGDEALLVDGDRYAPDQCEACVPADLAPCAMVAAGGVAAQVLPQSGKMRGATAIVPLGLVTDAAGRRLSTCDFGINEAVCVARGPALLGSSMNAGKTTTMAR
ncbi:MAG: hypothetical protein ACJA1L_001634 [Paracoccaceae bacterium]|jgi:hypothetical protein